MGIESREGFGGGKEYRGNSGMADSTLRLDVGLVDDGKQINI